jgi:hypothetical protein
MEDLLNNPDAKLTNEEKFKTIAGDLRVYNEEMKARDFDDYPKINVKVAEDLKKFQYGYIVLTIQQSPKAPVKRYIVQVDGLLSIVYSVYAKTLNSLRKPTIRQRAIRIHGVLRRAIDKFFKK